MIFLRIALLAGIVLTVSHLHAQEQQRGTIDRKQLVQRHNFYITQINETGPTQVGNGNFAFGFDITGLQTLRSDFTTMSHWGWHSEPLPAGAKAADFKTTLVNTNGRLVPYELPNKNQPALTQWLQRNPHRFNLGRVGLWYKNEKGEELQIQQVKKANQYIDLWTSVVVSYFEIDGQPVGVTTVAHPQKDVVAFRIESSLIKEKKLGIFIEFPYANMEVFSNGSDYGKPALHNTHVLKQNTKTAVLDRILDSTRYQVALNWTGIGRLHQEKPHRYRVTAGLGNVAEYVVSFSSDTTASSLVSFDMVKAHSQAYWPSFWQSGGCVDLSESRDPRWKELERRIVLSQYIMKLNAAGKYPAQETGLVNNSWYGRYHYEMLLWHGAHFALWDRWSLLEPSLRVYSDNLEAARKRAAEQGYNGARYPKCTGPNGNEWPHPIHAYLIWQQPHPIFFAHLDYRMHRSDTTLQKWKKIVRASADFLASYPAYDSSTREYAFTTPMALVSENNHYYKDANGTFELAYWKYGLETAGYLFKQLGIEPPANWNKVSTSLIPLPVQNGLYVQWKGVDSMWTNYNFEHPSLLGIYGLLPGSGVDTTIMHCTFNQVLGTWKFDTGWGWDFPMAAMTAARLGQASTAIDLLLHASPKNGFDIHGFVGGGNPYPYIPTNGALLYAIALMTAGWDGDGNISTPGFPKDTWVVKWEGLKKAP